MPTIRSLLCAALLLALAPAVLAHARVVRSSPAKGEVLSRPPERIELWFNELLDHGFNSIEIFPQSAAVATKRVSISRDKPVLDPRDRTRLTLTVEPLAPGEYVVEWRVLSRDGHSAPGRFTFRVVAP
jgi:methionine-rich copper-binding protein CopC